MFDFGAIAKKRNFFFLRNYILIIKMMRNMRQNFWYMHKID